jgi:hypothetical protein
MISKKGQNVQGRAPRKRGGKVFNGGNTKEMVSVLVATEVVKWHCKQQETAE